MIELRLWVKAVNVAAISVRMVDGSGQCHRRTGIRLENDGKWHEVVLKTAEIAGGEHWAGANDGKWHGVAGGFGLYIEKDGIAAETKAGMVYIDDVTAVLRAD